MKYESLSRHLSRKPGRRWLASFAEIETILGFALPASAHSYPAWWANQAGAGHSQKRAWMDAGWRTRKLDLDGKSVEFERREDGPGGIVEGDPLYERARTVSGINDHDALLREALTALIQREAVKRIVQAGGTMPDFSVAPRRRMPR